MKKWSPNYHRKKEFILFWCIMMIISLSVSFYVNYQFNHIKIGEDVYIVDEIKEDSWHFTSETGDNIVISNKENGMILWYTDDLTMSIGTNDYQIYQDYDKDFNRTFFIDLNGEKINLSRISSLVESKEKPILAILIVFFFIFTTLTCINMVYPEIFWKVKMFLVTEGGSPSDFYLTMMRVISILLWIIVLAGMALIV